MAYLDYLKIKTQLQARINSNELPVMFRVNVEGYFKGDVTAIFPTESNSFNDNECVIYAHYGQHGIGNLNILLDSNTTRLAKPQEYQPLLDELNNVYDDVKLVVITEITPEMNQKRIAQSEEYRSKL